MASSMTGFGRARVSDSLLDVTVEIKSVNHRYFEFSSRIPRAYPYLDEQLKSLCKQRISRGKVEISVQLEECSPDNTEIEIDEAYVSAYLKAVDKLAGEYPVKNDFTLSGLLSNPEVFKIKRKTCDDEKVTATVLQAANEAIDGFLAMRDTEGEHLTADIESRIAFIVERVSFIEQRSPETVKAYRARLEERLHELLGDIQPDPQRLLTEAAIIADKLAVDEETVRLRSHMGNLTALLHSGGAVGRKLDFVVQEMNREANTIGSKAQDIEINSTVVDIKAEIEKIREQIQNIE